MIVRTLILIAATLIAASAAAQYKYMGPDGKVVYSDTPAPPGTKGVQKKELAPPAAAASGPALPYALAQVAKTFPVTIFTTPGCEGCDQGRTFLAKRGIPFTEKTITTNEDLQALKTLAGTGGLPVLTVGSNKLLGYEPLSWGSALDTAGYPPANALPPGFRQAVPVALAPKKPAVAQAAPAKGEASTGEAPKGEASVADPSQPAAHDAAQRPAWFRGF